MTSDLLTQLRSIQLSSVESLMMQTFTPSKHSGKHNPKSPPDFNNPNERTPPKTHHHHQHRASRRTKGGEAYDVLDFIATHGEVGEGVSANKKRSPEKVAVKEVKRIEDSLRLESAVVQQAHGTGKLSVKVDAPNSERSMSALIDRIPVVSSSRKEKDSKYAVGEIPQFRPVRESKEPLTPPAQLSACPPPPSLIGGGVMNSSGSGGGGRPRNRPWTHVDATLGVKQPGELSMRDLLSSTDIKSINELLVSSQHSTRSGKSSSPAISRPVVDAVAEEKPVKNHPQSIHEHKRVLYQEQEHKTVSEVSPPLHELQLNDEPQRHHRNHKKTAPPLPSPGFNEEDVYVASLRNVDSFVSNRQRRSQVEMEENARVEFELQKEWQRQQHQLYLDEQDHRRTHEQQVAQAEQYQRQQSNQPQHRAQSAGPTRSSLPVTQHHQPPRQQSVTSGYQEYLMRSSQQYGPSGANLQQYLDTVLMDDLDQFTGRARQAPLAAHRNDRNTDALSGGVNYAMLPSPYDNVLYHTTQRGDAKPSSQGQTSPRSRSGSVSSTARHKKATRNAVEQQSENFYFAGDTQQEHQYVDNQYDVINEPRYDLPLEYYFQDQPPRDKRNTKQQTKVRRSASASKKRPSSANGAARSTRK
eukprot:gene24874-31263_t